MSDLAARMAAGDLGFLDEDALAAFVARQRWFGGSEREVASARVLQALPVLDAPVLASGLIEVRYHPGTHDVYQLLLGLRLPATDGAGVATVDGHEIYDAFGDPSQSAGLLRLFAERRTIGADGDALLEFRGSAREATRARPVGGEQSNSSVVFDERLILKAYRRLEAGTNPELELLRFLSERSFAHMPPFCGWFEHRGGPLDATLGVLQGFLPGAKDGWDVALEALGHGEGERFLPLARRLGEVTGELHAALGSEPSDPAFAPEEVSAEALSLLSAQLDEEVIDLFGGLPPDEALAPIAGRGEEVRERLRGLSQTAGLGRKIRTHGDYHLEQALWTGSDWVLVDFEGEPFRSFPERRRKRSPLRDVAGMLRSFSYAAGAVEILHGREAPDGWTGRAREAFLGGYLPVVEPVGLLPTSRSALEELLEVYELEKSVAELRYEIAHRPDWLAIPATAIADLLDAPTAS